MALEIIEQVPDLDAVVIPTGGGGLLAGMAVAIKSIRPDILIIVIISSFYISLFYYQIQKVKRKNITFKSIFPL